MSELLSIATTLPEHCVTAADTKRYLSAVLPQGTAARFHRMVDASRIRTRYSVVPIGQLLRLKTLDARNQEYERLGVDMGEAVARDALDKAGVDPASIDAIISVSSTGYMMPSFETYLVRRLGLAPTCRRIPLNQLGCAGGVAAVGLAAELLGTASARTVLIVSVELPSLCLQLAEPSPHDIISSLHFGDAAAAAVMSNRPSGHGSEVLASRTVLLPENAGGARLSETGLRPTPSPGLHRIVRHRAATVVGEFLASHRLGQEDISFWVVHPRTPQMLAAVAESLQLDDRALAPSRMAWERFGNAVSASVFLILRQVQESAPPAEGDLGVMLAFGAGLSCELVLLRYRA